MQKGKNGDESVRIQVAIELDAFVIEERLDCWRLPAGHNERRVDFAGHQFPSRDLRTLALPLTTAEGPSVIPGLNQYKYIGCSPGKHPDTRTMATGSDDDSRDSVHDRCLCIAV
jgi:hypothetical protein